jgi:predicted DNA-binding transcriptional regulator AlpA
MTSQILIQGYSLEQLATALKPLFELQTTNEPQQIENPLLTRDEVCKLLSFNKTSLWKHTKSGKLKSYGIGNKVYYKKVEVLEAVKPINH